MTHKEHLKQLLAKGKIAEAIKELLEATKLNGQEDLHDAFTALSGRFYRNEDQKAEGTISTENYDLAWAKIKQGILHYLSEYEEGNYKGFLTKENATTVSGEGNIVIQGVNNSTISINKQEAEKKEPNLDKHINHKPKVFISYNHGDKATALKAKGYLEKEGIEVTIDLENLHISDDIKTFIEKSIRENDVTLSIVSEKSLMSTWVGMETVNTFYAQTYTNKKFIAAFIEGSFFKRNFVDDTLDKIEAEIKDIETTISNRIAKGRNIDDLQNELKRYKDLAHHLPSIIQRLKESLSVNIEGNNFEVGMKQIVTAIKKTVIAEKQDTHKPNITQNAKNIYNIDHIDNANFS